MHLIKLTAILTAASAIVLCSCHKDHDKYVFVDTSVARSFVQQYDSIDELEFRQLETRRISVNIKHSKMGGLWNTHIYDSLCKKHNDLNFNGKINVGKASHIGYTAIGTDFQKIEISCNKGYNAACRRNARLSLGLAACYVFNNNILSNCPILAFAHRV